MLDVTALNNVLNTFLENEGFDCLAQINSDFLYSEEESIVYYSIVASEKASHHFLTFVKNLGFNIDCGYFVLAFFHELGHNETLCLFNEEELKRDDKIKATLNAEKEEDNYTYFSLPVELTATKWALDYISKNLQKVQKLAEDVQNEILNLIKKYQITP